MATDRFLTLMRSVTPGQSRNVITDSRRPYASAPRVGGGSVGAPPYKPLIPEPLYITRGQSLQYINTIQDLTTALDRDARKEMIYENPSKLGALAASQVQSAAEIDGCTDYYFNCPTPTEPPVPTTPAALNKRVRAENLRKQAALNYAIQKDFTAKALARGLKNDAAGNAQVEKELAFYDDLKKLSNNVNLTFSAVNSAAISSTAEWRKIQAQDIQYQTMRDRFEQLGFTNSTTLPKFTSTPVVGPGGLVGKGGLFDIPWTPIFIIGGLVAGAYFLSKLGGASTELRAAINKAKEVPKESTQEAIPAHGEPVPEVPPPAPESAMERLAKNKQRATEIATARRSNARPAVAHALSTRDGRGRFLPRATSSHRLLKTSPH